MERSLTRNLLMQILNRLPDAEANIRGSAEYPDINGKVSFWVVNKGIVVLANIHGLPPKGNAACDRSFFAMHIHDGNSCTGNAEDPFANAGVHFNPEKCMHPAHAGDLPPLLSNEGDAWVTVLTDRFTLRSIVGKTVIVHLNPDDFKTQPAGAAGKKIACGVIRGTRY